MGSVLGAAGVAIASAAVAPVAMPDSPNPLAAGDTGQGCIAGLMLAACMIVLGVASAPVAVVVYLASSPARSAWPRRSLRLHRWWAWRCCGAGCRWHALRLSGAEEQLVQKVTPAR